jgi:hypothetical protein
MNVALPLLGLSALSALVLLVAVATLVYCNLRLQRQNQKLLDRLLASGGPLTVTQLRALDAPPHVQPAGQPAIEPAPAIEPGSAHGNFPAVG